PNTKTDFYWTKNTYEMQPYFGWVIFFGLGSATASGKAALQYVRAVRSGYDKKFGEPDHSRFTDNGDGTITDNVTRLMWQKGENERTNWFDALEKCRDMRLAGYSDWRLPNIKELNTILNLDYDNGWWYFKKMFPANGLQPPLLHYFSSTPYEKFYVWVTNFCFGYDGYYASKDAPLLFRAVRNLDKPAEKKPFILAHSGQKECYNDEGSAIPDPKKGEPFFGQDGTIITTPLTGTKLNIKGEPLNAEASWKSGLRMVMDDNTGLIWEVKSPDPNDVNFAGSKLPWTRVEDYVVKMNDAAYGGFSDWRLPNREELRSIVDYGKYSPSIMDAFDNDCPPEFYWSKDSYGPNKNLIWGIYFAIGCGICYPQNNRHAIRVVRGGYNRAFGDPAMRSFKNNGDGTVTDLNSGLMWMKDETPELNWNDAMKYCVEMSLGGHSDWRLPNIREIATLIDVSFKDLCWFDKEFFPGVKTKPLGFYWATSTYASTFAWGVNFQFGYDGYYAGKKTGKYPFRPVRTA
ncbi:MAG: DUF1566 domain-containing protein, partial [Lentisphaerae bacterium]|nr:DUF1566 domain-containing protein [Lentisphaerota bacterium]